MNAVRGLQHCRSTEPTASGIPHFAYKLLAHFCILAKTGRFNFLRHLNSTAVLSFWASATNSVQAVAQARGTFSSSPPPRGQPATPDGLGTPDLENKCVQDWMPVLPSHES